MQKDGSEDRGAWDKLYSKRGLQYGGTGELSLIEPVLKSSMLVLDAGCGEGKTTEAVARKAEVVGCDFSREGLRTLRSQREFEHRVNLVECDIVHLPFESERFDAALAVHTLSHMLEADRFRAAEQLSRVLRRGGYMFVEGFGRGDVRFGSGEEVEDATFLRGNGILTHYFREGEIPALFTGLETVAEIGSIKRVSFGTTAGKRDLIRVLMRKGSTSEV
jgi:SAM-dependent methyltransferase